MIISKSTGVWGEGADEATFNLEVLGNTPQEVAHLATLSKEPANLVVSFDKGTLSISLSFKREVSLQAQAEQKAADEAKAAADAKAAAEQAEKEASAKAEAEEEALREAIIERASDKVAAKLTPKG